MDARALHVKIASAYDAVPYDTLADDRLDPDRPLGLGAVYGAAVRRNPGTSLAEFTRLWPVNM